MNPHSITSEGIILARKNYGEADRIISIYSKEQGRISVIAKGVRRPKSRKRGHLEVFNQINFQLVNGKGISIMTEAVIINDFIKIRKSLKKISLAYYFSEVIGKITHEGEANLNIYNLLFKNLSLLIEEKELKKLRLKFLTDLLTVMGYWPEGRMLNDPDEKLEEIIERQVYSKRVGKILSSQVE